MRSTGLESLIPLALLIVLFYFMLIRPQRRRAVEHQKLVQTVSLGDEVIMRGGEHGTVRALRDETIDLELAPGVTVKYLKGLIFQIVRDEEGEASEPRAGEDLT